ncbi:MAG: hypothetical protein V1728_03495 [Candidatus Micrarchaeota archaeon]
MGTRKTRTAQVMISDFVISLSIFLLVLILFYATWTRNVDAMGEELAHQRALQAANKGMDALVLSPGFPSDWAVSGLSPGDAALTGIGTAERTGNLDMAKVAQLAAWLGTPNLHNITLKKMGIAPYDADVRLSQLDGTSLYAMGYSPPSDSQVLASAQRLVTYANNSTMVSIRVWRAGQ